MFNPSFTSSSPPMLYVDNMVSYLFDDLNPSSKQQEAPSYSSISYYHIPSPLIYSEIDINSLGDLFGANDFALSQQPLMPNDSIVTDDSSIFEVNTTNMEPDKVDDTVNGAVEDANMSENRRPCTTSPVSRKRRSSKKDRHSKIRTAHGLRDRRMRLSLDVARPFFKLQDVLGYDKASRTVEWLLIQSKSAIEELLRTKNDIGSPSVLTVTKCTMSLNSDCEVESTIVEDSKGPKSKGKRATTSCATKDSIKVKQSRKRTTKESRDNARERARKRTLERLNARGLEDEHNVEVSPSWRALKIMEGDNNGSSSIGGKLSTLSSCNNQQNGEH